MTLANATLASLAVTDEDLLNALAARLNGRSFALPNGQGEEAADDRILVTKSPGPDGMVISTSRGGAFRITLAPEASA